MLARGCFLRQKSVSPRMVLGLQDGQSYMPSDIKKAFRERALTAHPDTGGDPDNFRQLQAAYEALLHEHSAGKNDCHAATASQDSGFYAHPHAQWSHDTCSQRAYWHNMHAEMNMNTNSRGSRQHASNTHYRARPHYHTYGEGLGEDFQESFKSSSSFASHGQQGSEANFSTWYFYRPYEPDYRNPYGTGFTPEEIRKAAEEQRRGFVRAVVWHACLWSGLGLVVYLHERNNRVWRAMEAREKGYQDPEYWEQLRKEEEEARRKSRAPLRLERHWLEAPLVKPLMMDISEDDLRGAPKASPAESPQQPNTAEERRRQVPGSTRRVLRSASGNVGYPRVVSYRGRPFTPNGVRGVRNTAPKTPKTYAEDITHEMENEDDVDECS
ncbi:hypothetical protein JKF63_00485 [Porcisia hertigi]|uniref:J domain-containing protein n=1 Tax=Porcisia hertigi TaxID=2761500 RepID=A0A836HTN3_9TRYP|nr:hypothetical protein JKF63_00485 [Porcisia hertigi]